MKWILIFIMQKLQHYNPKTYWKMREVVIDSSNKRPNVIKLFFLYKIKKQDFFNNASTGTHLNYGAMFLSPPNLPHHLNGIIVSHKARIGKNCTIYHQVTIENNGKNELAPQIIGANAVVTKDIPHDKTVIGYNTII